MASILERTVATDRVAGIIQLVRRRWRLRHVIAGLGVVVGLTILALWLAAMAMERAGFSEASITWARLVVAVVMIAVGLRWIAWPIVRRLSDGRVALYAEERIPSLDGALMSAVEATADAVPVESRASSLTNGLVDDAVRRLRPHGNGVAVEAPDIRRAGMVLAAVALFGAGAFMLGPDYLRYGAALIATPWKKAAEVAPYSIGVEPGNATVPKGTDLQVSAQLNGFSSELVEVVTRRGANTEWERIPMGLGSDSARFSARLFDLDADVEYYIESSGVRSGVFKLTVRNLPAVRRIDLELRYPAYTGLAPDRIEDGGDIAAVRGTRARVSVRATMPVRAGRLVFEGDSSVTMRRSNDSTLVGELVVREDGFYRVELTAEDGTRVAGSVEYVVDALDDMAPTIAIRKPGRDIRPTNVEEVFVEVEATDDFGVGKVELVYSVNGQAEKMLVLNDTAGTRSKDFIAGHTFFLEELGLQAGDVVSYFARATDGTGARQGQQAATDIYFMTVRPFGRDYRQNQQGGGGGGGGGANPGALTQQQRDIVAATFKAERDREKTPPVTFRENVTTIHLGQGRLREQVDELAARMNRPVVAQTDTLFKVIADYLKRASEEMKGAEEQLSERDTKEALPPEQRALQMLERAEAVYRDVRVSMGGGGGGGGGGQQESNAEDLADLFELETDKLRNQYEQVQRGEQQQAQQQVDETLERLKQLAARQQQENERARQRAQSMAQQGGGSGGGGGQRQLADQADSLARQLERLAREQRSQQMAESARRLQEAANEMRRAASQQGQGSSAGSALDQIESARRLLEEARQSGQAGGIEDAARRAQELANQQRDVARDVQDLASAGASRPEREQRLDERKTEMAGEVQQLQSDIERMSRDLARDRPEAARDLREAARGMREGRLSDKIQFSRGVMRQGAADYVRNWEQSITDDLDSLSSRLDRANATASGAGNRQGNEAQTLDRARDLVRGLSSIDDRMRDRENQAGSQQGQSGRQGQQQGQQGQGQQGQQGQGQQGQQGQGQQGQQGQGQQGQQGQQGRQGQGQGQQGQGGQGGQQGQGTPGQRGLDPAVGSRGGAEIGGGGAQSGGARGPYTGEDVRQYGRELRSQREAAEALRRELQGQGRNVEDLTNLIEQLRNLEGARAFNDPDELARLRSAVVQGFKEFEFTLRRQLVGVEADRPALGGNENVPPGYRDMVNEYFKSLSRKPTTQPPAKKPAPPG
jgi:hypothetical protein